MGILNVINGNNEKQEESVKDIKLITCMSRTEEFLANAKGQPTDIRRYQFTFSTLQADLGFGVKTSDMIQSISLYSKDQDRFKVGSKYSVEFKLY